MLPGSSPSQTTCVNDGLRESKQSWYEVLIDLKKRGVKMALKLAIGDGALECWAALRKTLGKDCRAIVCNHFGHGHKRVCRGLIMISEFTVYLDS
jgi:hypothetical protein